jgi:hypothetical protein
MLQCCCRSAIPVTASLGTTRKSHRAVMCAALLSRDDSCKPLASDSSPSLENRIQNASPLLTCLHFSTTAPSSSCCTAIARALPEEMLQVLCTRDRGVLDLQTTTKAGLAKSSLSGQVEPSMDLFLPLTETHLRQYTQGHPHPVPDQQPPIVGTKLPTGLFFGWLYIAKKQC